MITMSPERNDFGRQWLQESYPFIGFLQLVSFDHRSPLLRKLLELNSEIFHAVIVPRLTFLSRQVLVAVLSLRSNLSAIRNRQLV